MLTLTLYLSILLSLVTLPGSVTDAVSTNPNYQRLQRIEIKQFPQEDNLSNRNIKCVVRDSIGYLWIATQNGLNRYDGARVKHYFADPYEEKSIVDNYIQYLFVDSEGDLWILVPGNLHKYNRETDDFTRFEFTKERKNTHTSNPGSIIEGEDGIIWVGTPEQGLYAFDKKKGLFDFKPLNTENIDYMIFDDHHNLWIGSPGKVYVYNVKSNTYKELDVPDNDVVVSINPFSNQLITRRKAFNIIPTHNSFYFESPSNKPPFIEAEILYVYENNEFIWFGTRGKGIIQYSKADRTFNVAHLDKTSYNSVSDNTIRSIYEDRFGIIWVSTENGLNNIYTDGNKFTHHSAEKNELTSDLITSFTEDNEGNIWMSTFTGVTIYNPQLNIFQNLTSVAGKEGQISLSNARDITIDNEGMIWILLKNLIVKYNPSTHIGQQILLEYDGQRASDLLAIFAKGDDLWVGTYGNGVFLLDGKTGRVHKVLNTENSEISSDYVKDIIAIDNNKLVFATLRTGVDFYDVKANKFSNIRFSDITQNYVSDYINSLYKDSKNNIWALSWHGAFVLDTKGKLIKKFFISDGLPSNEMNAISEDRHKTIWIGTDNGIGRILNYDNENMHVSLYSQEDGLTYNNISTGCIFSPRNGDFIYIGTPSGLDIFDNKTAPNDIRSNPPVIVGLKVFDLEIRPGQKYDGRLILSSPIEETREIKLNYDQNNISIIFSSFDFNKIHSRRYAYMLTGIDKDWVYTDSKGSANYNNLSPGNYIFKVKTMNVNGSWSTEKELRIVILPPWWQTWWAIIIYILAALATAYLVFRTVRNRERMRQEMRITNLEREKENEIYEIKQRLYTNITHDMRTALTLIAGPISHALKNESLPQSLKEGFAIVEKNTGYLRSLVDQVLDFRKIEVGLIKPTFSKVDLRAYLPGIVQMFDSYAFSKQIKLEYKIADDCDKVYIDKSMMAKVLYNLIGNAIKFTPENGNIHISSEITDGYLVIRVKDNGIGIESSRINHIFEEFYQVYPAANSTDDYNAGSGIGLAIVKKYVEIHQGTIEVESAPNVGTTFKITIPVKPAPELFEDASEEKIEESLPEVEFIGNTLISHGRITTASEKSEDKYSVLIVDDNSDIITYLKSCLLPYFNVLSANNGKEGLDVALKEMPDLIISDVMMPQMDGFKFGEEIKRNELTHHIPLLFLTAKTSQDDAIRGLKLGATDYLKKPFNEDILISKIKNLLADRNTLREKIRRQLEEEGISLKTTSPNESGNKEFAYDITAKENPDPFLTKVMEFINQNIENPELSMDLILREFHLGRMQLYRKLKAVSDLTASDLIREQRMQKAKELLTESNLNVSEIAYMLNFSDPFYFSNSFKKKFGMSPSQYRNSHSSIS